jgi:hypothetical protein
MPASVAYSLPAAIAMLRGPTRLDRLPASGDEVRLSWPAATCGQNTTSGGSTTCRASQGALVCGVETYRRE